jgi:predicted ATPase/class 3 adenylate cyclase
MATQVESGRPASARPTGTVTFLFSDIEGSTSRWDADPEAMAEALARHDAVMRAVLEAHGAYIFKTIGDAFCAAFARPQEAIASALDVQRRLAAEDFSAVGGVRVRMALHLGTADERDGDYFGPAVNRVARLLAIGHGGQVLISGTAADLLQGEMPVGTSVRDLGEHRLKDLTRAEHVYQLITPDLPHMFPPLRSLDELPNNLPPQLTSFVGRDEVVSDIKALIGQHRLVMLTGAGGVGKTRCAIQVGADLLDGWGDGVWLAELALVSDPALVPNVIAEALNAQEQRGRPILDTLLAYLKRKHVLLILDNCEHVIGEARHVVAAILRDCAQVHILATSREPLNLQGEETYRMPSLAVPSANETRLAEGVSQYGAVQLFLDRAVSSDKRFALTEANAPYVAEICERLDGIPLAIELAAARVKILAPQQLARKLDERFRLLIGGDPSALPRQQTMRALIDWSYDLLSSDERALLRQLSIFAGGFTLETAAAVCGDGVDEIVVLDLLSALVDKSLVQTEPAPCGTRYRLPESTQQYAREKLRDAGEEQAAAHAHAGAFLALAERLDQSWETTPDRTWIADAEPDLDNFRSALTWTLRARGDVLLGQRLLGALRWVWGYFNMIEGERWVQVAQEFVHTDTPTPVIAALDLAQAQFTAWASFQQKASLSAAERALIYYCEFGDPQHVAAAKWRMGSALAGVGKIAEGQALLREALAEFRSLAARKSAVVVLRTLAVYAGDIARCRQLFREALTEAAAIGAELQAAVIGRNLAESEFMAGQAETALQLAREALQGRSFRVLNTGSLQNNMAAYLVALRRCDEARAMARDALAITRDAQNAVLIAFSLQHLAAIAALRESDEPHAIEDRRRAARLLGYVDACIKTLQASREYTEQSEYDTVILALRDALGEEALLRLIAEGGAWSEEQAVTEAMLV